MDTGPALDHRRRVSDSPAPTLRRNDLDWIRVAAFGLLILYHVALVYAPYDWHIHSTHTFPWLHEALLLALVMAFHPGGNILVGLVCGIIVFAAGAVFLKSGSKKAH